MSEVRCKICKVESGNLEKGVCPVCREINVLHETISKKLRTHIQNPNIENEILKDIDELAELSKESQWQQCKQAIIDAMYSERLNHKTAWRLFVKLQGIEGQSQHLENWEIDLIKLLRKDFNYSMANIAFILGRSTATIHKHLGATE